MRCCHLLVLCQFLTGLVAVHGAAATYSFQRDVVRGGANAATRRLREDEMNTALLAKAVPLAELQGRRQLYDMNGAPLVVSEQTELGNRRSLQEEEDDFYVDYNERYSFSGYSLKYAKCQPVQYFSEEAIAAGVFSPMVTQDIVILRLCPTKSCTDTAQYGCHYNFAEYAISLSDYLSVMLKYSAKRRDFLCDYCEGCGVVYQGGNVNNDGGGRRRRRLDDAAAAADEEDAAAAADEQDAAAADENGNAAAAAAYDCTNVDTYCANYDTDCADSDERDDNDSGYMAYEDYLDYLQCAEVKYNDRAYFVRPRCDGYKGTIKMDAFYDMYCVQYAGNDVSVKNFGMGFREGIFEPFYSGSCTDCSDSGAAPFYDTNTALCNKLHATSAKCTSDLLYNLFDGESSDSTECSYIESIRFGTYAEDGQLSSSTNGVTWTKAEVSSSQKVMLIISIAVCIAFVIYSCYLHHAMTNLLIKSLSHRELLPPSRHRQSRRAAAANNNSSNRHNNDSDGSDDWEKPGLV
jgi:hypothetical protein